MSSGVSEKQTHTDRATWRSLATSGTSVVPSERDGCTHPSFTNTSAVTQKQACTPTAMPTEIRTMALRTIFAGPECGHGPRGNGRLLCPNLCQGVATLAPSGQSTGAMDAPGTGARCRRGLGVLVSVKCPQSAGPFEGVRFGPLTRVCGAAVCVGLHGVPPSEGSSGACAPHWPQSNIEGNAHNNF